MCSSIEDIVNWKVDLEFASGNRKHGIVFQVLSFAASSF